MKNKIIFISIFLQINLLSNSQVTSGKDSIDLMLKRFDIEKKYIDKYTFKSLTKDILLIGNPSKRGKVTTFSENNILRKLIYVSGNKDNIGKDIFYFDKGGQLFLHIISGSDYTVNEFFFSNAVVNSLKENPASTDLRVYKNDKLSLFFMASAKFEVDYCLSNFDSLTYKTFDVSKNQSAILKASKNIDLRKQPTKSSNILKSISKGQNLFYLDRSSQRVSLDGKSEWVWYKIKTKDGVIGWIWGSPTYVNVVDSE